MRVSGYNELAGHPTKNKEYVDPPLHITKSGGRLELSFLALTLRNALFLNAYAQTLSARSWSRPADSFAADPGLASF